MVIDWNKQIDECIKNTKFMPIFHGTPFSYQLQKIYIVKRLLGIGYNENQIVNWFTLADAYDAVGAYAVDELINLAKVKRFPKQHDFSFFITMNEIEYIDKLKTTKVHKAYLLGLICFAKAMKIKHKSPSMKPQYSGYVYYIATGEDAYSKGKQCYKDINKFVSGYLVKHKIIRFSDNHTEYMVYTKKGPKKESIDDSILKAKWVDWDATDGYRISNLDTDVKTLVDLAFHESTKKCSVCKTEFIITPYTKTDLCPDCQKKLRQSKKSEWFALHPTYKHDKNKTHSHGKRDNRKNKTKSTKSKEA